MSKTKRISVLVLTGSVGVGKTSVADAIADILSKKSIPNGVIDLDALRNAHPRPKRDPFHMELGYKNLAAVSKNYREIGVTHFVIPNVVESRGNIKSVKWAIPSANLHVVRLAASLKTIHRRLKNRERGDMLKWHLNRALQLTKQLEDKKLEDFVVDTEKKSVEKVAKEILRKIKWL